MVTPTGVAVVEGHDNNGDEIMTLYERHTARGYAFCGCGIPNRAAYRVHIRWEPASLTPGEATVYLCEEAFADYEADAIDNSHHAAAHRLLVWDDAGRATVTEVVSVRA